MTAVPTLPTVLAGYIPTGDDWSNLLSVSAFLLAPPIAELRQTVVQSIPNNSATAVLFDTEDVDSAGGHSTSVNTSRYTAVYAGWYEIGGAVVITGNATGTRAGQVNVNGAAVNGMNTYALGSVSIPASLVMRTRKLFLNVGDYVEMLAYQTSGGALNTDVTGANQSTMSIKFVSN